MAELSELIEDLDTLLEPDSFDDYGPNGVQVPGREDVEVVVTGVSAHLELFERAVSLGAGLVLVHHGLLWDKAPRALTPALAHRLELLLSNDITLAAYHLPLDAHPALGNNALIAEGLGCEHRAPFAEHAGKPIGVIGRMGGDGIEAAELFARVESLTGRQPLVFDAGPGQVRAVGIVSGGGAGSFEEAIAAGLDAFVTGEPSEPAMAQAREAGVHFVAAGHYATETFGVRALGERLAERFGVTHHFVDVPNPV